MHAVPSRTSPSQRPGMESSPVLGTFFLGFGVGVGFEAGLMVTLMTPFPELAWLLSPAAINQT